MSDHESDDSESDVDYVPSDGEAVSEEEQSGDDENFLDSSQESPKKNLHVKRKRVQKQTAVTSRKRRGGIRLSDDSACEDADKVADLDTDNDRLKTQIVEEKLEKQEENEEKRTEDLWQSFISDVGKRPGKNTQDASKSLNVSQPVARVIKQTVTKTYDFAGEKITVTEKVDDTSKLSKVKPDPITTAQTVQQSSPAAVSGTPQILTATSSITKKNLGGLSSVLGKINKTPKLSCLDKSKHDWDVFKQKEGITEELLTHNKGKDGYIQRLDFLSRTDQRQFDIEKDLRQSSRKYLSPP